MPPKLDPGKKKRAAELVGLGLSDHEAGGAVGISHTFVERLLAGPE